MDPAHLGKCSLLFLHIQKGNMWESGFSDQSMPEGSRGRLQSSSQKRLCGKRRNTYVDLKTFVPECLNLLGEFSQVLCWLQSVSVTTQGCCVNQKKNLSICLPNC